jgi:hypothetical protein
MKKDSLNRLFAALKAEDSCEESRSVSAPPRLSEDETQQDQDITPSPGESYPIQK